MHLEIGKNCARGSDDILADRQTHTHRRTHQSTSQPLFMIGFFNGFSRFYCRVLTAAVSLTQAGHLWHRRWQEPRWRPHEGLCSRGSVPCGWRQPLLGLEPAPRLRVPPVQRHVVPVCPLCSRSSDCSPTIRYDTIRYGRLTCAQKLTRWAH